MDARGLVVHETHTPDGEYENKMAIQTYLRMPGEPLYEKYEGGEGEDPVVRASLYILAKIYNRKWTGFHTMYLGAPHSVSGWNLS